MEEARDSLEQVLLPGTSRLAAYVHEWSPGDFVLWDNRSTLHSATEDGGVPPLPILETLGFKLFVALHSLAFRILVDPTGG